MQTMHEFLDGMERIEIVDEHTYHVDGAILRELVESYMVMGGHPAILREKQHFESGLQIEAGAQVFVQRYDAGDVASYYPSPYQRSHHSFAIDTDAYMTLVPARLGRATNQKLFDKEKTR